MTSEENVNYASVVFTAQEASRRKVKQEEACVYAAVTDRSAAEPVSAGFKTKTLELEHLQRQRLSCCLGIVCVLLLLSVTALSIYFTLRRDSDADELKHLNAHLATLTADVRNLTDVADGLTLLFSGLTLNYSVLATQATDLTAENGRLEARNRNLSTENRELETQRNELKEQMENMETRWNELNVSRAQWAVDHYCPRRPSGRRCDACQAGWETFRSSCYAFSNAQPSQRRTWEGARDDCRGKNSDLAVVVDEAEKEFVSERSWSGAGIGGYWIGLSAEGGGWKWVNGSFLTEQSWIREPSANDTCVTSLQGRRWESVGCDQSNAWVCKKQALSV